MQIKCDFCGNVFQDTLTTCPHCGATNQRVIRTAKDQPLTIADLQEWYESKGLPPYETTRFFIGENVHEPRAFGIYQDGRNFVVYKNKADGTRAVRYEGEDEAYAVNELFQRLKQEILQQKSNSMNRSVSSSSSNPSGSFNKKQKSLLKVILILFVGSFVLQGFGVLIILFFMGIYSGDYIKPGYYKTEQSEYYYYDDSANKWFGATIDDRFDSFEEKCVWSVLDRAPKTVMYNRLNKSYKLKHFYVSREYESSMDRDGIEDFKKSLDYQDYLEGNRIGDGYYTYEDTTYYHISQQKDDDWYYYDNDEEDWHSVTYYSLPVELRHNETSDDFYVTKRWDESTQVSDFQTTDFYENWMEEKERERERNSYSNSNDNSSSYDNSSYDWGSNDSWDSNSTDWDSDW